MYKEMNDYINNMSEGELAMLCNDIYDWNATGKLSQDSNLYRLSKSFPCPDIKYVADIVIDRSYERFAKIVSLLFRENPSKFLRNISDKLDDLQQKSYP